MRILVPVLLLAAGLPAQQRTTSTSTYDLNGRAVTWTEGRSEGKPGDSRSSETIQTLNGRRVTLEQADEKVLKNEGGVRVVERIVRRTDAMGNPLPPEKTLIETTTRPDGTATEKTTVWRGDLNGRLQPAERSVAEIRTSGETTTRETSIERMSISGAFEPMEKRSARETKTKTSSEREETVYRVDTNGRFSEAGRQVVKSATKDGETSDQTDEYEAATTGRLQLARQTVGRTVKEPGGEQRKEVDVYGPAAPGRAVAGEGKMQLREKQIYTTRSSADGTSVEVFSIQRPGLNRPGELGPVQKISETVTRETKQPGK